MSCEAESRNATAPEPGVAPPVGGGPAGQDIDPARVAQGLVERFGPGGGDPRVADAVPGFDAPFFQAGLCGYSDAAMRIVARRHGCPACVTESLLDITLLAGGRGFVKADLGDLADNVPGGDEDTPLIGQIMGCEPRTMAAAAIKMVEQGSRSPKSYRALAGADGPLATGLGPEGTRRLDTTPIAGDQAPITSFGAVDVNLACPVKKIRKKARGGHWLAQPDGAIEILEAVRESLPPSVPVTVKMRRGFDDTPEMAANFERIFDAAYDIGCAWVTVHGRTVEQKYVGPSRWDLLREIVSRAHERDRAAGREPRVVFGSRDIWTAADVFRMIAYTGASGASVARGCIGNPWMFRQCRDLLAGRNKRQPSLAEQREVLAEHFELAMAVNARMVRGGDAERAESFTGRTMRKFGIKFAALHPDADTVQRAFTQIKSLDDWQDVLEQHYGNA